MTKNIVSHFRPFWGIALLYVVVRANKMEIPSFPTGIEPKTEHLLSQIVYSNPSVIYLLTHFVCSECGKRYTYKYIKQNKIHIILQPDALQLTQIAMYTTFCRPEAYLYLWMWKGKQLQAFCRLVPLPLSYVPELNKVFYAFSMRVPKENYTNKYLLPAVGSVFMVMVFLKEICVGQTIYG